MSTRTRKRISFSPEKMVLTKLFYDVNSNCARTFFILGEAVVWAHCFHAQVLNGIRAMKDARDPKALENYGGHIIGNLTQEAFDHCRDNLTGVLGDNRRRNKAGRLWLNVPDEDGSLITVISFWAHKAKISASDVDRLRNAFQIKTTIWVDYYDRKRSTCIPV